MAKKSKSASDEKKQEEKQENKGNEIRIRETEEDVVLGSGFSGDPDEFKDEIKKDAEKGDAVSKFLIPLIVFVLIAGASIAATWYWARPEKTVPNTEDKIQTPPKIDNTKPAETKTPTPVTPAPQPQAQTYTVQSGDTMSGIANKYNMTSTELAKYNGITEVDTLKIGQVLKIPVK